MKWKADGPRVPVFSLLFLFVVSGVATFVSGSDLVSDKGSSPLLYFVFFLIAFCGTGCVLLWVVLRRR